MVLYYACSLLVLCMLAKKEQEAIVYCNVDRKGLNALLVFGSYRFDDDHSMPPGNSDDSNSDFDDDKGTPHFSSTTLFSGSLRYIEYPFPSAPYLMPSAYDGGIVRFDVHGKVIERPAFHV